MIVCIFLLCSGVFLLFRGVLIQFFPNKQLLITKSNIFEKMVTIKPRRGIIYDRYGRELALSVSSFSLFADPSLITQPKNVSKKISALLKISQNTVWNKIKNKQKRFVWIKRHVSEKEKKKIQAWNIYGLGFIEEPKRIYPGGAFMSQVLGFTGVDGQGLEGLELVYDHLLKGREQKLITPKDARGRPLFIDGGLSFYKSKGSDIYLTIDSDLQFVLERELGQALNQFKAKSAMGIILDAQTSEILALSNLPNFNPNRPFQFPSELYRNRIVSDAFEPGSTFKTFIVGVALKQGIAPRTQYDGQNGKMTIGKHTIHEATSDQKYGKLSVSDILSLSSNVGAASLALDITANVLRPQLEEFGFGKKMDLDFPLEGKGILQPLPWRDIATATIGFGQGVSATPLQMVVAYTAIANGGFLKKPYLLRSTMNLEGQEQSTPPATPLHRVLTKEQTDTLTLMLTKATAEKGTGYKARIEGFLTAGKTGTAQKPNLKTRGYLDKKYISNFIGFVPADRPQFVIYVALDEPSFPYYSSLTVAPIFSVVGSYALRRAGVPPSFIKELNVLQATQETHPILSSLNTVNKKLEKTPNFKGLSLREALQKAKELRLKVRIYGSGLVTKTVPFSGTPLPENRKISLVLSESTK